jgi:hypothetical protein
METTPTNTPTSCATPALYDVSNGFRVVADWRRHRPFYTAEGAKVLRSISLRTMAVDETGRYAGDLLDLCAVVTVSDDGGSSGRLRKELNMLPPGDIRNCIVALSEDEALLSQPFSASFRQGVGPRGP